MQENWKEYSYGVIRDWADEEDDETDNYPFARIPRRRSKIVSNTNISQGGRGSSSHVQFSASNQPDQPITTANNHTNLDSTQKPTLDLQPDRDPSSLPLQSIPAASTGPSSPNSTHDQKPTLDHYDRNNLTLFTSSIKIQNSGLAGASNIEVYEARVKSGLIPKGSVSIKCTKHTSQYICHVIHMKQQNVDTCYVPCMQMHAQLSKSLRVLATAWCMPDF